MPTDWPTLAALVFLLGLKHGFDADHLATIDGLTRLNARAGRPFARWCGTWFSIGHGAVVLGVALAVGGAASRWSPPAWFDAFGAWVSIGFLVALALANMRAVIEAPRGAIVRPIGVKGRWLGRLRHASHPASVAAVGALFALSFDTLSQAALFAVSAMPLGGFGAALALGLLFVLGMLVTDGVNGLWISRLIARADQVAAVASRAMGLGIAAVSLLAAAIGLARRFSTKADDSAPAGELALGAAVVAIVLSAYFVARRAALRKAAHP